VLLGGIVGADRHGEILTQLLEEAGADCGGVFPDARRPTTTKTRVVAQNQQVVRVDTEKDVPLSGALEMEFSGWFEGVIPQVDACVLSDYAKGVVTPGLAARLIRVARREGRARAVVVDPKGCDYSKYRGATVVKPNQHEAEQVLRRPIRGEGDWVDIGRVMLGTLAAEEVGRVSNPSHRDGAVLITRGSLGMTLLRPGIEPLHIPALARNVFDVTGAGDTVAGTLALALGAGASLEEGVRLANRAAGVVVGKFGTASLTRQELLPEDRPTRKVKAGRAILQPV
jgi:rfaE bifunctional protein kinase chain/domain